MYKLNLVLSSISFFFFGLEFNYYFMAFAALSIIIIAVDFKNSNVDYINVITLLIWSIYFISLYIFGYTRLTNSDPITYIRFILTIVYIVFITSYLKKNDLIKIIKIFCISTWLAQLIIIIHSYYLDSSYYGRGRLFFYQTGEEINSPIIGILLSISLSTYLLISKVKVFTKLLMAIISIVLLLYIGSRTGLLITILLFIFSIDFKAIKYQKIAPMIISLICVLSASIFYLDMYLDEIFLFTDRLGQRGIDSPRYEMWKQGLNNILDYPFGGMSFNVSDYQGVWFHNILLDTARTSGLIPLCILLILLSYYIIKSISLKNKKNIIVNLIIIMSLMSDVIIEGGGAVRLIFLLIIFNSYIPIRKLR